ncbi:MAG: helix-turn-helix domain-containing protein [Deferribacterales bacterium]
MKSIHKINIEDELLTYEQLAEILQLSPKTLKNWKSNGVFKIGRDYIKTGTGKGRSPIRFIKSAIIARIKNNSLK